MKKRCNSFSVVIVTNVRSLPLSIRFCWPSRFPFASLLRQPCSSIDYFVPLLSATVTVSFTLPVKRPSSCLPCCFTLLSFTTHALYCSLAVFHKCFSHLLVLFLLLFSLSESFLLIGIYIIQYTLISAGSTLRLEEKEEQGIGSQLGSLCGVVLYRAFILGNILWRHHATMNRLNMLSSMLTGL